MVAAAQLSARLPHVGAIRPTPFFVADLQRYVRYERVCTPQYERECAYHNIVCASQYSVILYESGIAYRRCTYVLSMRGVPKRKVRGGKGSVCVAP